MLPVPGLTGLFEKPRLEGVDFYFRSIKYLLTIQVKPVRTIENWESGKRRPSKWVEKLIIDNLKHYPYNEYGIITESKGVYTVEQIKDLLLPLTLRYKIVKLVLFGSYSKGMQDEKSDIDLIVYGEDLFWS